MVSGHSAVPPTPSSGICECLQFAVKWTPRAIVAGLAGYNCLGVAYSTGLMAAIDRIAIRILLPHLGWIGLGAFMPTFQWYSAWGVRMAAALGAGILYDLTERICRATFRALFRRNETQNQTGRKPLPV